jgi:hypothetical protein
MLRHTILEVESEANRLAQNYGFGYEFLEDKETWIILITAWLLRSSETPVSELTHQCLPFYPERFLSAVHFQGIWVHTINAIYHAPPCLLL